MILNKIINNYEISRNMARKILNNYINKKSVSIQYKKFLDKTKEKCIEKYFNKLIDNIFDEWVEDGKPIEISNYEIKNYSKLYNEKVKKISEELKHKIKRENIKLSFKDNTINLQEQFVVSYNMQIVSQYPEIIKNENINYSPSETAKEDFIETCLQYNNKISWAYYKGKEINLTNEKKKNC